MALTANHSNITKKGKLFKNGGSQAIRLPVEFQFDGTEVYITRNSETGELTVSSKPPRSGPDHWNRFFELRDRLIDPNDPEVREYMTERPLNVIFDMSRVQHGDDE
jgi:antitoxin VapB